MPAHLAVTERAFACPLHPTWSTSLRGCERRDLVRCERQWTGWQPFSGGFICGRVIGLRGWPRPLAVICFTQRQTESGWRTHSRDVIRATPPRNGDSGLCISPDPLEEPPLAKARRDSRHGAQKEGCHDRCFQQGLRSAVRGQTNLRSMVWGGIEPAHQLLRNASSMSGQSILPTGHTGTTCASTLRQQVHGVIHKSPGRPRLEATLHAGERPSCVGPKLSALTEGNACAGQNEPSSRHVVEEQRLFGGMDASPAHCSENLGKARLDLFASKDNSHFPIFFTRSTDMCGCSTVAFQWIQLLHSFLSVCVFHGNRTHNVLRC